MEINESRGGWALRFTFIIMMSSSYVLVEPSPYDLLMVLLMVLCLGGSVYLFPPELSTPLLLLCLFCIVNLFSLIFAVDIPRAVYYFAITLYLIFSWICLTGLSGRFKERFLISAFQGYLVAAIIAAAVGILAYFQVLPNGDSYLMFGRVKSLFKDPNVFGPFITIPTLYALYKVEVSAGKKKLMYLTVFLLLLTGILLSYSRAAWGAMVIMVLCYFSFLSSVPLKKRMITIVLISLFGVPSFFYLINTPLIENLLQERLSLQNYDGDRFENQKQAFTLGFSSLLGAGPGQTEHILSLSAHSLFARILMENGLIGFLSFMLFLLVTLIKSLVNILVAAKKYEGLYIIIFAAMLGLIFNSIFVDTLHWRHFWIVLALAWCPAGLRNGE
ncbi:O-antigen ligase family protein [Bacillus sp. SCS-153A]|uniref:O-antigen ligase family protein n=1 Tax=Rossellomorea sedimentorum TaxID=3115294 RepID=UPI003905A28F